MIPERSLCSFIMSSTQMKVISFMSSSVGIQIFGNVESDLKTLHCVNDQS